MAVASLSASPRPNPTPPMAHRPRMPPSAARFPPPRRQVIDPASTAKAAASVTAPSRAARRPAKPKRASPRDAPRNERFLTLYSETNRHLAVGIRRRTGGGAGLLVPAGIRPATSLLSDHSDHDAASRRQPGDDGQPDHRTARAPARADPGADAYDILVFLRDQPDYPAIRSQPGYRRGCPGRAIGHQCRGLDAAPHAALSAHLRQG